MYNSGALAAILVSCLFSMLYVQQFKIDQVFGLAYSADLMWNVNLFSAVGNHCPVTRDSWVLAAIRKERDQFAFVSFFAHLREQKQIIQTRMYCVGIVQALAVFYKRRLSEIDLLVEQYTDWSLGFSEY